MQSKQVLRKENGPLLVIYSHPEVKAVGPVYEGHPA